MKEKYYGVFETHTPSFGDPFYKLVYVTTNLENLGSTEVNTKFGINGTIKEIGLFDGLYEWENHKYFCKRIFHVP